MMRQPWTRFHVKDTDKGPMVWEVKAAPFWAWRGGKVCGPYWLVLARNVLDPKEQKSFLSDAAPGTPQVTDADQQGRLAREYFKVRAACPFLEEESCSIYPDRPLSCREYLVTSPAAWCRDPESGTIEKVPLDAKATQVLFRFDDGEGKGALSWLPLVLTLEWAVAHGPERQPRLPGGRLFQNFLQRLAEPNAGHASA